LDLNALYIKTHTPNMPTINRQVVGDHNKPLMEDGSSFLTMMEESFLQSTIEAGLHLQGDALKRLRYGFVDHQSAIEGAQYLSKSPYGEFVRKHLEQLPPPEVVGLSLLHAGQVLPAITVSIVARDLFPESLVVWGGPHISGLGNGLEIDLHQRGFAADVFVTGHAEKTFVDVLGSVSCPDNRKRLKERVTLVHGTSGSPVPPMFEDLEWYSKPLTLPAQSSLGCAYGRCSFCTYPSIEPNPTKLPLNIAIDSVVGKAASIEADVAIKDSLATPLRLQQIAGCVDGRVKWSACTKLSPRLSREVLEYLGEKGLATLEVGLESLLPESQRRIDKIQPPQLYETIVKNVATVEHLHLVVNYMVGFPWEYPQRAEAGMEKAQILLKKHLGEKGHLELNHFELERLSPMMKDPAAFGIDEKTLKEWPWVSVLERMDSSTTIV